MRCLRKNMSQMYYSLYSEEQPVYDRDDSGEVIYTEIDGRKTPVICGMRPGYSEPVEFYGNIAMSGGEAEAREYGVNTADYQAVLIVSDKSLPITETSRIWQLNAVQRNQDGTVNGDSADYSVLMVKPSLNSVKYLLKKLPKGTKEYGK